MAYYSRRRYSRAARNRKALTNKRIYGSRGAKAQASQIAALRNRLNFFAKRNKPETKCKYSGASHVRFTNEASSGTWKFYPGTAPVPGDGDDSRSGDFIRVKSLTWYFTFEYLFGIPGAASLPDSEGATIRIILGQFRHPVASNTVISTPGALIQDYGRTGASYTHNSIAPLKNGVTDDYRILKDKRFTITRDNNQKLFKLKVKPRNYRWNSQAYFQNCFCFICVSGLHWDTTSFVQYVDATVSDKIVYSDA